ncbi:peptidylprolyl isomerase domain and WD repeat-containing 1 isoform X2 [Paramuricea clavata]|uniref:Peptidylprolyl isomerase domain and WD repeat-containing 1 isoform X2 n=1 Tax=Paramuricea clavata TaxID=317549 RepID=A0A6S7I5N3_PARCT|nr:peptidylprolyl isomerase domain and WD repeat-containing 1 isoform X2 [Paramuricea clavata]
MAEEKRSSKKRAKEEQNTEDESEDEMIGPLPVQASKPKKKKVLEFEQVYLDNLPSSESYEKSYMHRDFITHIVATGTDFLVTASCDGHVKFWKKTEEGIEFVKHFRSHLGTVQYCIWLQKVALGAVATCLATCLTCPPRQLPQHPSFNVVRSHALLLCQISSY